MENLQGHWWIDDDGGFHPGQDGGGDLDHYFFSHLGMARLAHGPHAVELCWDAHQVGGAALMVALDRLSGLCVSVRLCFYYFGWRREYFPGPGPAIERALQIQENRSVVPLHEMLIDRHPIDALATASPFLADAFAQWERAGGRFDRLDDGVLAAYLPRVLMIRQDDNDGRLIYSWIGGQSFCARVYGQSWVAGAVGGPADTASGPESEQYADLASTIIRRVLRAGEPEYHHVCAQVDAPEAVPVWHGYERLIVPHTLPGGAPAVAVVAQPRGDLSIRLAGAV